MDQNIQPVQPVSTTPQSNNTKWIILGVVIIILIISGGVFAYTKSMSHPENEMDTVTTDSAENVTDTNSVKAENSTTTTASTVQDPATPTEAEKDTVRKEILTYISLTTNLDVKGLNMYAARVGVVPQAVIDHVNNLTEEELAAAKEEMKQATQYSLISNINDASLQQQGLVWTKKSAPPGDTSPIAASISVQKIAASDRLPIFCSALAVQAKKDGVWTVLSLECK